MRFYNECIFFKDIALETRLLGQISQIRSFFTMSHKSCYRKWVNKVGDMKTCTEKLNIMNNKM